MNRILSYALIFVAIVGGVVFFAWRKAKNVRPDNENLIGWSVLPTDFHDFFDKFHADSAFQMAHIRFPLAGLPHSADSALVGNFFWKAENWELHNNTAINDTGFVRTYTMPMEGVVSEIIRQKQPPHFGFVRRFTKTADKNWELIYYVNANQM